MRLHRIFAALLSVAALGACEKNAVQDLTGPLPSAKIRFFNFGVNAPAVHFYTADRKLTATASGTCSNVSNPPKTPTDTVCLRDGVEAAGAIGYGSVSAGALYTGIEPGQYTFSGKLMSGADKGVAISNVAATIGQGKTYSVYQSGFYDAATKAVDAFIVEDDYPATIDWTKSFVRFVNAISNSSPMTMYAVNVDPTKDQTPIAVGGEVAYKAAGAFTAMPSGTYNLYTRYAGSATDRIVRANVAFELGRVYSITARGDMTVVSTTATNRPFLDNTLNR